jgi:hypothetical protein
MVMVILSVSPEDTGAKSPRNELLSPKTQDEAAAQYLPPWVLPNPNDFLVVGLPRSSAFLALHLGL